MKKILCTIVLVGGGMLVWNNLSDSKKRFTKELARQIPFLIPRYFV